jgi:hypothetical protein
VAQVADEGGYILGSIRPNENPIIDPIGWSIHDFHLSADVTTIRNKIAETLKFNRPTLLDLSFYFSMRRYDQSYQILPYGEGETIFIANRVF